ncbi:MAG: DUF4198 domain-containing protein [Ginsengibacter sp.]
MKKILIVFALLTILITAFAHECILIAYKWRVNKGDTLEMHLFIADGMNIQLERPMEKDKIKKFEIINENGQSDLLANTVEGTLPIINSKVDFEGLGLIFMERDYAKISLPTDKFLEYLKEDHIENIIVSKEQGKKMQRERYSRFIKALVQSGKIKNDTLYKTVTGENFEIILLENPYKLHKGATLSAQVFFKGKPLAGKIITARNRRGSEPSITLISRTNTNGICSFKLQRPGDWMLHATHMVECQEKEEADWESFWTTFSFGIN